MFKASRRRSGFWSQANGSCLTTDATAEVAVVHDKAMPVILTSPEEWDLWRENQHAASSATSLSLGVKDIFEVSGSSATAQATVSQLARASLKDHGLGSFSAPQAAKPPPPASAHDADQAPPTPTASPPAGSAPGTSAQAGASTASPEGLTQLDQLLSWYKNGFEAAILADLAKPAQPGKPKQNSALPLYATLDLYVDKELKFKERIPQWPEDIYKALDGQATAYSNLVSAIAEIKSVTTVSPSKRLTDFYEGETPMTVSTKRIAATKLLTAFQDAAQRCEGYVVAAKPKTSKGEDVVTVCDAGLKAALDEDKVAAVQLKRKYEDPTAEKPAAG